MWCFDLVKYSDAGNPNYTLRTNKYNLMMTYQEINDLRLECCPKLNNQATLKKSVSTPQANSSTNPSTDTFIMSSKYPYPPKPNKKYKKN